MALGNSLRLVLCGLRTGCFMCCLFVHCDGSHLENSKSTLTHLLWGSCHYVISDNICIVLIASCVPPGVKTKSVPRRGGKLMFPQSSAALRIVNCKDRP